MSYLQLYRRLVCDLTRLDLWRLYLGMGTGMSVLFCLIVFLISPPSSTTDDPLIIGTLLSMFISVFTIVHGLVLFLLVAFLGTRDPVKPASKLAARLMAEKRRLDKPDHEVNYQAIVGLKKMASIDQAAADWRGVFVNFVVIGSGSLVIGLSFWWTEMFTTLSLEGPVFQQARLFFDLLESLFSAVPYLMWPLAILVVFAVMKLLNYLYTFLVTESANRTILFACEELEILFGKHNLTEAGILTKEQRHRLLEDLGWKL